MESQKTHSQHRSQGKAPPGPSPSYRPLSTEDAALPRRGLFQSQLPERKLSNKYIIK